MRWFAALLTLAMLQAPVERRAPAVSGAQAPAGLGEAAGAPAPKSAQNGDEIQTIKVRSRLVNIAVNAVDSRGAPVAGLGRDDFAILEDGKPQKIAVFERESSTPLSIVLAVDTSETVLTNERLERDAAKRFVRALLRDQDELDLMDFSDTVREIVPFTNQKKRIEAGLGQLQRGAETSLFDAIYLGSDRLGQTSSAAGRRRVMVLITDGGDTKKRTQYPQAVEAAQRAGAMIFSVIIVPIAADAGRNTGGEHALIQMSEDTGGRYYYVADPRDLEAAFAHVSDDLRTQYVLGYYAPDTTSEGAFRRIQVRLKGPAMRDGVQLRYRSGYYADGR